MRWLCWQYALLKFGEGLVDFLLGEIKNGILSGSYLQNWVVGF